MAVWDDPEELGRRIAAARGYAGLSQADYGDLISRSDRTVAKMESGDLGALGRTTASRKQIAQLAIAAGAPPEFFGLDELQGVTRAEMAELIRELRSSRGELPPEPGEDED